MLPQWQNPLESERPRRTDLLLVLELARCNELLDKFLKCVFRQQSRETFSEPQNHEQQLLLKTISRTGNPCLQPIACPIESTKDLADQLSTSWGASRFGPSRLRRFNFDLDVRRWTSSRRRTAGGITS